MAARMQAKVRFGHVCSYLRLTKSGLKLYTGLAKQ